VWENSDPLTLLLAEVGLDLGDLGLSGAHLAELKKQLLRIHQEVQNTVRDRTENETRQGEGTAVEAAEEAQKKYAEHILLSAMRAARGFRTELLQGGDMSSFIPGTQGKREGGG